MNKILTYLGGIIGGYTLIQTPIAGTWLSGLDPILDAIGSLAMIVFAGALIVQGVRTLLGK